MPVLPVPALLPYVTYLLYRFSAYALLNLMDDAAMLAIMFC